MDDKKQLKTIEKYINGQLSIEERADFEKRLKSDSILASRTSSYRNSLVSHLSASSHRLKHGIIAVGKKSSKLSKQMIALNQKKKAVKILGIVLIIATTFVITYFIFDKSPNYAALFNEYYKESISEHPLLKEDDLIEVYGITHYQNRDLSRAISALEKEVASLPSDTRLYLYLGLAYLESNNYTKAKLNFEKAEKLSEGRYRDASLWYLSLTQIKLHEIPAAKEYLIALANQSGDHPYKQKARQLLNEL